MEHWGWAGLVFSSHNLLLHTPPFPLWRYDLEPAVTSPFSDLQTRLYAAQAARKVEFEVAAEHIRFQPQEVQVSGC